MLDATVIAAPGSHDCIMLAGPYIPCTQPIMCFKSSVDLGRACGMWLNPCAMVNQFLTFFSTKMIMFR
jgi:hypothetical protein